MNCGSCSQISSSCNCPITVYQIVHHRNKVPLILLGLCEYLLYPNLFPSPVLLTPKLSNSVSRLSYNWFGTGS